MNHFPKRGFRPSLFPRAHTGRSRKPKPTCSAVRLVTLTIPAITRPVTQSKISTVKCWSRTPAHSCVRSTPRPRVKRLVRHKKRSTCPNPNHEKHVLVPPAPDTGWQQRSVEFAPALLPLAASLHPLLPDTKAAFASASSASSAAVTE